LPEPVFVDLLGRQGIDSQPGGSVRKPICRTGLPGCIGGQKRFPWNRFLGSINVYKYGLSLCSLADWFDFSLSICKILAKDHCKKYLLKPVRAQNRFQRINSASLCTLAGWYKFIIFSLVS